jgi:hypothetical protein
MTQDEVQRFLHEGCQRLTNLNIAIRQLDDWAGSFALRGGMEVFGNDAALIAGINNKVQATIESSDRATVARLRLDV